MVAAQIAGRSAGARAPEVLLRGRAVAVPLLPAAVAAVAAVLSLTRTPHVHWWTVNTWWYPAGVATVNSTPSASYTLGKTASIGGQQFAAPAKFLSSWSFRLCRKKSGRSAGSRFLARSRSSEWSWTMNRVAHLDFRSKPEADSR